MFRLSRDVFLDDTGSTTEAALLVMVFASFAMVLLHIIDSDWVRERLAWIVEQALNAKG